MKPLTLTVFQVAPKLNSVGGSLRGPRSSLSALGRGCGVRCLRAPLWLSLVSFRGYPRLTAPVRGKTRLNAPNRAKKFSGEFPRLNRGCATETATTPQVPARDCINLHLLARLASTCGEKNLCRFVFIRVLSWFDSHNGKSSHLKLNQGNYRLIKPPKYCDPGRDGALRRPSSSPNLNASSWLVGRGVPAAPLSFNLNASRQPTAKVGNCRLSKNPALGIGPDLNTDGT